MKTHIDHILIQHARAKVEHRLTHDAKRWLDHESTELSAALYRRGCWTFYCPFALVYIVFRQMPRGDHGDVMLHFRHGAISAPGVMLHFRHGAIIASEVTT
jgi:hypothetical protein